MLKNDKVAAPDTESPSFSIKLSFQFSIQVFWSSYTRFPLLLLTCVLLSLFFSIKIAE